MNVCYLHVKSAATLLVSTNSLSKLWMVRELCSKRMFLYTLFLWANVFNLLPLSFPAVRIVTPFSLAIILLCSTLLRCAGNSNNETLSSKNMFFADSLPLIKTLAKGGNALLNPDGKPCKSNLLSVYQAVFFMKISTHTMLWKMYVLSIVSSFNPRSR